MWVCVILAFECMANEHATQRNKRQSNTHHTSNKRPSQFSFFLSALPLVHVGTLEMNIRETLYSASPHLSLGVYERTLVPAIALTKEINFHWILIFSSSAFDCQQHWINMVAAAATATTVIFCEIDYNRQGSRQWIAHSPAINKQKKKKKTGIKL